MGARMCRLCFLLMFSQLTLFINGAFAADEYPLITQELAAGRDVWVANCETCHAYGTAGAPNPLKPREWEQRLQTPMPMLHKRAIEGFYGKTDTYMPPRGGNPELSDEAVVRAVDYMVALVRYFLEKTED